MNPMFNKMLVLFSLFLIFMNNVNASKEAYFVPRNSSLISNEFAAKDAISIVNRENDYITTIETTQKNIFLTIAATEELNLKILFNETVASINKCPDVIASTLSYQCKTDSNDPHYWIMFQWNYKKMILTVTRGSSDPSSFGNTQLNIEKEKDLLGREISLVDVFDLNLDKIRLASMAISEELNICPLKLDRSDAVEDRFSVSSKTYLLTDIELMTEPSNCGMAFQFSRDSCCVLAIPKSLQNAPSSTTISPDVTSTQPETTNTNKPNNSKTDISVLSWKLFGLILICLVFILGVAWWKLKASKSKNGPNDTRYSSVPQ